jgi:ABC-type sugar transport system substrate-binding protein
MDGRMGRLALAATFALLLTGGVSPAAAANSRPWCLIFQDWDGGWACAFDSFEQCRVEARAGNSGFCAANPFYEAPAPVKPTQKRRKTR